MVSTLSTPRGLLHPHPRRYLEILMLQSPLFCVPRVASKQERREVGVGVLEGSCHRV